MNLQALAGETVTASTDPNFNNNTFEEKFNNGWLKYYFYAVAASTVFYLAWGVYHALDGLGSFTDSFRTFLFLVGIGVCYLIAGLSLFLQFQAIKTRSLEKQDMAIRICQLFIVAIAGAAVAGGIIFGEPIQYIFRYGVPYVVYGIAYLFAALNVKRIMLGKSEESFRFDKSAFQA